MTLERINVEGSRRIFDAAAAAGVPRLIHASSVGAYSRGPKDREVDEGWPTEGTTTSFYSRHKVAAERELDRFEADNPETRVVRLRPALIFKDEAATEIRRLFIGPFLPNFLLRRGLLPALPRVDRSRFQAVHSEDVGEAYLRAVLADVDGAFNIAAEPPLSHRDGAPQRAGVVVVDMINPYRHPEADRLAGRVSGVLGGVKRLIQRADSAGVPLIYVNDNYGDWNSSASEFAEEAMEGAHPELVEPILPSGKHSFVIKARHSVFYETPLEYLLDQMGIGRSLRRAFFVGGVHAGVTAAPPQTPLAKLTAARCRVQRIRVSASSCRPRSAARASGVPMV